MADTNLFLAIATTGLRECSADPEFRPEIIQFALASSEGVNLLTKCIVPAGAIQPDASKVNGYSIKKDENGKRKLMRHGKEVKTVGLNQAIHDLLVEIEAQCEQASPGGRIVLIGYNSKKYDMPVLEDEIRECGLSTDREPLNSKVICADLYDLIRTNRDQIFPSDNWPKNFRMTTVYNELCGKRELHVHNAVEDARKLAAIYDKVKQYDIDIQPFMFSFKVIQGRKRKNDTGDSSDYRDRKLKRQRR